MSDNQTVKVRLKTAWAEIEYEGSETFLRSDLLQLLQAVFELYKASPPLPQTVVPSGSAVNTASPPESIGKLQLTTNSIASKLGCNTGPDLIIAACSYLTFVQQQETFKRKEILDTMKKASTFYKRSYNNNFTNYLDGLVKDGKLLEQSDDVYSLSAPTRKELELKLAN